MEKESIIDFIKKYKSKDRPLSFEVISTFIEKKKREDKIKHVK